MSACLRYAAKLSRNNSGCICSNWDFLRYSDVKRKQEQLFVRDREQVQNMHDPTVMRKGCQNKMIWLYGEMVRYMLGS